MGEQTQQGGMAIRVDGGLGVGMGHVIRSLALVEAWRVAWQLPESRSIFYMRDIDAGVEMVRRAGYPVVLLAEEENPVETTRALCRQQPEILLVDLYDVGQTYINMLRDTGDPTTVCLTDLDHVDISADLLVNGFLGLGSGQVTERENGTCALLGAAYKILRPQFAGLRSHPTAPKVENVLITTGGGDSAGAGLLALQALHCQRQKLKIHVLRGVPSETQHDLEYAINNHRHQVRALDFVEHMAQELRWADLVISAAGDTLYEIAACGTPAIVLAQVEHQLLTAAAFEAEGAAINLGLAERVSVRALADVVAGLIGDQEQRRAMSANGQRLVDGRGVERITRVSLQIHEERADNRKGETDQA